MLLEREVLDGSEVELIIGFGGEIPPPSGEHARHRRPRPLSGTPSRNPPVAASPGLNDGAKLQPADLRKPDHRADWQIYLIPQFPVYLFDAANGTSSGFRPGDVCGAIQQVLSPHITPLDRLSPQRISSGIILDVCFQQVLTTVFTRRTARRPHIRQYRTVYLRRITPASKNSTPA